MQSTTRDALLATGSAGALSAALSLTESLSLLARPAVAAAGIAAALAVESLFVAETPATELWERPAVQVGSAVALVGGAVVALLAGGPWVVAAACWGLATYFLLLALVLAGVWSPGSA
ncbi:hypothetical protein C475_17533 [Halosimplex carlsbadense 2-9-1]|uniref:Uncharacterized protein n=1 Tax=Halosimplex carlsbadense 2-9-1 TaxID=797114 RepID=M0CIZ0_9EURY|nr:hypothetical protein [Halosimplex carlsbadense]ELZ22337.1 hypothetical protein C475_17533 [Halosimplex carlsbadense 2-9-1]